MADRIQDEFREIGHCGGKFSVTTRTESDGRRSFQVGVSHSSPTAASFFMIGALQEGIPIVTIELGGWATDRADDHAQMAGALPVMIASDQHGLFGHECCQCGGYWRSDAVPARWPITCTYCGQRAETHNFLTQGQRRFVKKCCDQILEAVNADEDGEHIIDMDLISDEIAQGVEPPSFYYSETSQQSRFQCDVCKSHNDILGKYGYCSCCGTRNNLQVFRQEFENLTKKLKKGDPAEECVKHAVSQFDACGRSYLAQLASRVAMMPKRRKTVERILLHDLERTTSNLESFFGIKLLRDVGTADRRFLRMMFQRRHIYEHNAGVADEKYLELSGDTSVKNGQAVRETPANVARLTRLVVKMAVNLHEGFHEIFPPDETAIAICGVRKP